MGVYESLLDSFGYFKIEHSLKGDIIIFRDEYNIELIDVDSLNLADYHDLEITLEIVDNYELHKSSNGEKGSHKEKVSVKDLGSFKIYR